MDGRFHLKLQAARRTSNHLSAGIKAERQKRAWSAPSVLRYSSSADAGGIRQILHVRFRLAAGEGEHEFARAGLAIAARLGKRVFGRARW